ncbi:MAG: IS1595 family transposase [Alphaproteobacteria bacterium]|nr:MAG: IS1595 family transposase [Alphaproteobacteria bacterium]
MTTTLTIQDFFKRFPDDDTCLDHIMATRYGKETECPSCGRKSKFHRIKKRRAYECQFCGYHLYPCVGTPFEKSRTSLQLWFYAMFLFCATRNGVAAKELQRQLGVTYKTAWRMGHEIRKYMAFVDGDGPLGGNRIVEADKAYIGGKDKQGEDDKSIVLGIVERGGEVITRVVSDRRRTTVVPHLIEHVKPGTRIATDEGKAFADLHEEGYRHGKVNHSMGQYVNGPVHTNTIEGFWAALKRGVKGTHIWVSPKHLQKHLCEFEYRFNLRETPHLMFDLLLLAFPSPVKVQKALPQEEHQTAV